MCRLEECVAGGVCSWRMRVEEGWRDDGGLINTGWPPPFCLPATVWFVRPGSLALFGWTRGQTKS